MALGGRPLSCLDAWYRAPSSVEPATDELDEPGDALVDVGEAPHLQGGHDLVVLEHAHAAGALEHRLQRRGQT